MKTICRFCDHAHTFSTKKQQAGRQCVTNDPKGLSTAVVAQLTALRGVEQDCAKCLAQDSMEAFPYGLRGAKIDSVVTKLVCRACTTTYYVRKRRKN